VSAEQGGALGGACGSPPNVEKKVDKNVENNVEKNREQHDEQRSERHAEPLDEQPGAQRAASHVKPHDADGLESICAQLDLVVSAVQILAMKRYLDLLQRWNVAYNLTAVRERQAMLSHHFADCLAIIPALLRWQAQHNPENNTRLRALDVGSGGGLPGVVMAVMLASLDVVCVDTVGKKAAFVRQVAGSVPLPNLRAEHARVEALKAAPFHLITSRAFATLADFVRLSRPSLAAGGAWLAMKGKLPNDEMAALPSDVEVFHVEQLQVPGLDAQRCLVWMRPKG
jgi:16S rRNA (guanine527-N7)-methyltransferase